MQIKKMNRQAIIAMVKAGDVGPALAELMSCYSDPVDEDAGIVYDAFNSTREQMRRDNTFLSPTYFAEVLAIRALTTTPEDSQKITDLLNQPLSIKFRLFNKPVPDYLADQELNDRLMKVQPLHPNYLAFDLPEEVKQNGISKTKCRKIEKVVEREENMDFTEDEMNNIMALAFTILDQPQHSTTSDIHRYAEALMLMTGRRPSEIWSTITFIPVKDQPFQAIIRGAAKGKSVRGQPDFIAPLLMPVDIVNLHIDRLRSLIEVKGLQLKSRNREKCWGRKMTATHFRGLYCRKAYEQRFRSGFLPHAEYGIFSSNALGHKIIVNHTSAYTSVNVI